MKEGDEERTDCMRMRQRLREKKEKKEISDQEHSRNSKCNCKRNLEKFQ